MDPRFHRLFCWPQSFLDLVIPLRSHLIQTSQNKKHSKTNLEVSTLKGFNLEVAVPSGSRISFTPGPNSMAPIPLVACSQKSCGKVYVDATHLRHKTHKAQLITRASRVGRGKAPPKWSPPHQAQLQVEPWGARINQTQNQGTYWLILLNKMYQTSKHKTMPLLAESPQPPKTRGQIWKHCFFWVALKFSPKGFYRYLYLTLTHWQGNIAI